MHKYNYVTLSIFFYFVEEAAFLLFHVGLSLFTWPFFIQQEHKNGAYEKLIVTQLVLRCFGLFVNIGSKAWKWESGMETRESWANVRFSIWIGNVKTKSHYSYMSLPKIKLNIKLEYCHSYLSIYMYKLIVFYSKYLHKILYLIWIDIIICYM